jgi:hypothetical protein
MRYVGTDNKIEWEGDTNVVTRPNPSTVMVSLTTKHILMDTGTLIPRNWIGKRVKVTIELINE